MLCYRTFPVLCALILFSWPASIVNAQIRYTDINPDKILSAVDGTLKHDLAIDLNQDGKVDFKITHRVTSGLIILTVTCNTDSVEEAVLTENGNTATALESGAEIGANSTGVWLNTTIKGNPAILTMSDLEGTPWYGAQDKYLALAVKTPEGWQYGWLRMDVAHGVESATIKDFAVQLTPGSPITAGDNGTSPVIIPESSTDGIRIASYARTVVVEFENYTGEGSMSVYSLLGIPVGEYTLSSAKNTIPLTSVHPGTYVALVQTRGAKAAKLITVL